MSKEQSAAYMQSVMEGLVKLFPDCAVTLLVSPFGAPEGARTNYISNARRQDMLSALREVVGRFEGRTHDAPAGRQ